MLLTGFFCLAIYDSIANYSCSKLRAAKGVIGTDSPIASYRTTGSSQKNCECGRDLMEKDAAMAVHTDKAESG
jgi:hypothetical protein